MAAIHDLLAQVQDESLRKKLEHEVNKLTKQKKFGLVFEEHLPECTPLYEIPIKCGATVAKKTGSVSDMYIVRQMRSQPESFVTMKVCRVALRLFSCNRPGIFPGSCISISRRVKTNLA